MPGKYERCGDEALGERLHQIGLEQGAAEEFGDSTNWLYYAWLMRHEGKIYIVKEDSYGFVDYTEFEDNEEESANEVWADMEKEWTEAGEEDEVEDDERDDQDEGHDGTWNDDPAEV